MKQPLQDRPRNRSKKQHAAMKTTAETRSALCMTLNITKQGGCKNVATHKVRQMMLDKPIREMLTMSTGIEAKKNM